MKIGLVGAIDRNNYGDILFPLIVENELKKRIKDEINFIYYGTIDSNLSEFGAKETKSLISLKDDHLDTAIIVGGEVLSATWNRTYLHLQKNKYNIIYNRVLNKIIGIENAERRSKKKLGLNDVMNYPWIINKEKQGVKKVIYNTVSGTDFTLINQSSQKFKEELAQADFISVRDSLTKRNLETVGIIDVKSAPDSAFKMSDVFPVEFLERNFSLKNHSKHISFQVGKEFAKGNEEIISNQLAKILDNTEFNIELVSIGAAALHEDKIPLQKVRNKLIEKGFEKRVIYVEGTIFETMYSIASSSLFIGTSLHGNITALSYGKPSIALDNKIKKLNEFLKQYSIKEQMYGVDYKDIYGAFKLVMKQDISKKLYDNSVDLKKEIDHNFDLITEVILS